MQQAILILLIVHLILNISLLIEIRRVNRK